MSWWAKPKPYVLVIGAAHIDVIGDYQGPANSHLDRIGEVRYSVGGTAYNVAVTLGQHGISTEIVTALKKDSFTRVWIIERLQKFGVGRKYIRLPESVPESGFVAIRCSGELQTAVTASGITEELFTQENLGRAIKHASIVFAETNLSSDQLDTIRELSERAKRPMALACVSDSKARRIVELRGSSPDLALVLLNEREFALIHRPIADVIAGADTAEACRRLHAVQIVVTRGASGHSLLTSAGVRIDFPAPDIERINSTSGAGDALTAAVLARWHTSGQLDIAGSEDIIAQFVREALQHLGATRGSLTSDLEIARLAKLALKSEGFVERYLKSWDIWKAVLTGIILPTLGYAIKKLLE